MLQLLFPTPIYLGFDPTPLEACRALYSECDKLSEDDPKAFQTTLAEYNPKKGGVTWDALNNEKSKEILDVINTCTLDYLKLRGYKPYTISIDNLWLNLMKEGSEQAVHQHYGYTFSGVYYVDLPDNTGKITFHSHLGGTGNSYHELNDIEENGVFNSFSWWLPVMEGSIVIFPSYLKHSVPKSDV